MSSKEVAEASVDKEVAEVIVQDSIQYLQE